MSAKNQLKSVLISGASIAGPALAFWLHRYGFDVTIVERAPALRPGGYGVDLRGAAITVVERMGILQQIKAADTNMQGTYFVNAQGNISSTVSEAALGNHKGDIEIMRDDLSSILYNLSKNDVTYIWRDSIATMSEKTNGVDVTFASGKRQTFDIVVGADGIHSEVRKQTFGDEAQFMTSLGSYISIFTLDNYQKLDHCQKFFSTPGKTVGMYSARNNTEAKGIFVFMSPPLAYDHHNIAAQKQIVHQAFTTQNGWETQHLLGAMHNATDFYFDAIAQIHMANWSRGRITLVGDAAYCPSPLSGQGSSLAIVGAYVLAGELKACQGDYTAAFANYEQQLRTFVEQNQKIGKMVADGLIEKSNFKIKLRTATMRIPGLMSFMFKFITKMIAKAANAIDLKTY